MTRARAYAFAGRAALLVVLWWVLAEGSFEAPLLALALVCAAAAASFAVYPSRNARWRASGVPALAGYFMRLSLLGGWDVARRAFAPSLPVHPALVRFEVTLPAGFPTVLFTWLVSLTPGTASVAVEDGALLVHALDSRLPVEAQLRELEAHVAVLYHFD